MYPINVGLSVRLSVCLFFRHKSCPLNNSKTVQDIFMKVCTKIDYE